MSDGVLSSNIVIGRGVLTITTDPPITAIRLRYEIQSSGIKFYNPVSGAKADTLFNILDPLVVGASSVTGKGHLTLVSLPAAPNDAFRNISLTYSSSEFILSISEPKAPFAVRGNTAFKDLNLRFTERKVADPTSGVIMTVSGGVSLVLFDQTIPLTALLKNSALAFVLQSSTAFDLSPLTTLNVTAIEVGANYNKWAGLQSLYTFDEVGSTTLFDSSGSVDNTGQANPLNLDIKTPTTVKWLVDGTEVSANQIPSTFQQVDGISVSSGTDIRSNAPASKIVSACQRTNEVTLEAWIKPALVSVDPDKPPRIVTLSQDHDSRNLSLQQGFFNNASSVYTARIRTKGSGRSEEGNGNPPLSSPPGKVTTDLSYIVFTRSVEGHVQLYINGVKQLTAGTVSGTFQNWAQNHLAQANELTNQRPWAGEFRRVAIYNLAVPEVEVVQSYYPSLRVTATLTLKNVPAPLNQPTPVEFSFLPDMTVLTTTQTGLEVVPFLRFDQLKLVWKKAPGAALTLAPESNAALTVWENSFPATAVLSPTGDGLIFSVARGGAEIALDLKGLGRLSLSQFALRTHQVASEFGWDIQTAGSGITFAIIPPPLKGPFPVQLLIEAGQLWLSINLSLPMQILEPLVLDQVSMRFGRGQTDWDVQSDGVSVRWFDTSLPLIAKFVTEAGVRVFSLEYAIAPTQAQQLSNPPGQLQLFNLFLKAIPVSGNVLWQLSLGGYLGLKQPTETTLAGLLLLTAIGRVIAPANSLQSATLQGTSRLQSLTDTIFTGDFGVQGRRFILTGKLTMFPRWSPLQINEDARIEIDPAVRLSFLSPLDVILADLTLLDSQLSIENGVFSLRGLWLGESIVLTGLQRDNQFLFQGQVPFTLPFALPLSTALGLQYEPHTAVALTENLQGRSIQALLLLELSNAGCLIRVNSLLQWKNSQWRVKTVSSLTLPDLMLFAPPTTRNALLGQLMDQLKANATEVFATQFRHDFDYVFGCVEVESGLRENR